nr:MAG TPA: portal protein [Caudoviricetes sp.]
MADQTTKKRGRPRKIAVDEDEKILTDNASETLMMEQKSAAGTNGKITINQVAESLFSLYGSVLGTYNGKWGENNINLYNPFLQNSRLKMINASPVTETPEEIAQALKDPGAHEEELKSVSAGLSARQYLYYKILREACDVPMYKSYFLPETLEDASEYTSKKFREEEAFVEEWKDKLDPQALFKRIGMEVKREGKPSYIFRQCIYEDEGKKHVKYVTFQKLPAAYTKLTGIGEHGYIASFNLMVFMNPAFSPLQYPEFIRKIWDSIITGGIVYRDNKGNYAVDANKLAQFTYDDEGQERKGTIEIAKQAASTVYLYWVQLPQDLCFTFMSDGSNAWSVPDTISLFSDLQELSDYSTLAGLIASSPLTAVLTGQAEFIDGAQPGQDQTKIRPTTLNAFQNFFNSIVSGNVNAFFGPFKDMKLQSLPNIPNSSDIKTKAVQNFISSAGEGGLIVATDKPSVAMIKGAQMLAESQYDYVTRQIETATNTVLEKWCGCKYKWKLKLWGGIYTFDSQVKNMKELVSSGATFVLPRLASAYDMSLRQVRGVSSYIDENKLYDKFKTLGWAQSIQNAQARSSSTQDSNGVGRTALDDTDIENDSTAQSRETGANITELKEDYVAQHICPLCGSEDVEDGHFLCSECEEKMELDGEE